MKHTELNRRDFTRLTAAAFGGVIAGTVAGCAKKAGTDSNAGAAAGGEDAQPAGGDGAPAGGGAEGETAEVSLLLEEPHVCRGLNTCASKGKGGGNACAGQGACASAEAHACAGQNACKGQGGCGGQEGTNACKGMGGCHVPLEHGWEAVRTKFEAAMNAAGKTFGDAPPGA